MVSSDSHLFLSDLGGAHPIEVKQKRNAYHYKFARS
jgi:hypothetical protein